MNSPFGFDMNVSTVWLVLTAGSIRENQLTEKNLEHSGVGQAMLKRVLPAILAGQSEMIFVPLSSAVEKDSENFINIIGSIGDLTGKEIQEGFCEATEDQLTTAFDKPTKLDRCKYRQYGKVRILYFELGGFIAGTKSVQYHAYNVEDDIDDIFIVFSIAAQKKMIL